MLPCHPPLLMGMATPAWWHSRWTQTPHHQQPRTQTCPTDWHGALLLVLLLLLLHHLPPRHPSRPLLKERLVPPRWGQ
jgi:hypothetical protein